MNTSNATVERAQERNAKKEFEHMVEAYVSANPAYDRKKHELEVSFGTTRHTRAITKMDYDNTIRQLYAAGFTTDNARGVHMLRISEQYVDARSGENRISNMRAEIMGIDLIQEYCKTNSIQKILDMPSTMFAENEKLTFTQKTAVFDAKKEPIRSVAFPEFSFNVKYQMERDYRSDSPMVRTMIDKWTDRRKVFRHLNRVQFRHPTLPVVADLSIVRRSRTAGVKRIPIPEYTIQDAGVYENEESYEIELELLNSAIGAARDYNTAEKVLGALRRCIRLVLSAIQGTPYPVGKTEQSDIIQEYMKTVHGATYEPRRVRPKDFVGPSSVTLRLENIAPLPEPDKKGSPSSSVPNIRAGYCATDKADGERKLLYVGGNGRIYLIDTNMNIQFTGMMSEKKELFRTILDGEHILYDKTGKFINLYAAFDIYYIRGKSVREFGFIRTDPEMVDTKFRLPLLIRCIDLLKPKSVVSSESPTEGCADLQIKSKQFYVADEEGGVSIFDACEKVLTESVFEYNTDGLILTPVAFGVAGDAPGRTGHLFKPRWVQSFKWKPAEFNTIDFLVSPSNTVDGKEEIHTILPEGVDMSRSELITQYKVISLRCGFKIKDHGYLNPFQDVIDGNIPRAEQSENDKDKDKDNDYLPVPFQPTNPYDPKAHLCNVPLTSDGTGHLHMATEEGEFFEEGMIVEFKYDLSKSGGWRWVPLRVRYDKTAELRSGSRNFGNSYDVADSNWTSIHNPVTKEMLTTGLNIPEYAGDEEVYYNNQKTDGFDTKALKDFHNLYVKRRLITGVSQRKDTLIDFAVGKAGDLSKWVSANLSFVFGVDVSKDNIHNRKDGACARYLTMRRKFPQAFDALFLNGNSGLPIRTGEAFATDKDRKIARAIFGNGAKDRKVLEEGVYKHHGVGQEGFSVSSCQFALHYFFENAKTLHHFLRNVADCTALGGYFIGTCYDGKKVFRLLRDKLYGESFAIHHGAYKVFEITKMYDETGFPEDELSLGYGINVYQESINQTIREYLVNFDYLVRIMDDYGFVPIPRHEAEKMGLPNGVGSFESMFADMENELRRTSNRSNQVNEYGTAPQMTDDEKTISFLNRFFVFRKMRTVNTAKITELFDQQDEAEAEVQDQVQDLEVESVAKRTKKYLDKAKRKTPNVAEEELILAKTPAEAVSRHFIRKIEDVPRVVISDYEPPKETPTGPSVINKPLEETGPEPVESLDSGPSGPLETVLETLLPGVIELSDSVPPPKIVRGEIKKVIRVPKKKLTIR